MNIRKATFDIRNESKGKENSSKNENLCNGQILQKIKAKNAKTIADAENQDPTSSSAKKSFRRSRAHKYVSNTSVYKHVTEKPSPELQYNLKLNQSEMVGGSKGHLIKELFHSIALSSREALQDSHKLKGQISHLTSISLSHKKPRASSIMRERSSVGGGFATGVSSSIFDSDRSFAVP